jgi:endoglucanase
MPRKTWLLTALAVPLAALSTQALATLLTGLPTHPPAAAPAPPRPAVRLNGIGYAPADRKVATIESESPRPLAWTVTDAAGRTLLAGTSVPAGRDAAAGRLVHRADFSALSTPGTGLRLRIAEAESPPFAIAAQGFAPLARDALGYFYHNRAGEPIEARLVGERWARPAGHPRELATCFKGTDDAGTVWPGCNYSLDVTGGWYDAGDHGKYVVNGGISTWTLLNLAEWARASGRPSPFPDGSLRIPEAGNGTDDLLDEVRHEVAFLLAMQVPDGTRAMLPVGPLPARGPLRLQGVDASGMAHAKVADEGWTALPMRPDRDPQPRRLYPPSTAATLNLAAVAAQCARVWRTVDPAFADRCLAAARRAWAAALRNPAIYAAQGFTGSGGYGDADLSDEFFWAAAELHAATGDPALLARITASPLFTQPPAAEAGWPSVAPLGLVTLALADPHLDRAARDGVRARIAVTADRFRAESERSGYAIPDAGTVFQWGSNSGLLNRAMLMALAGEWRGDPALQAAAAGTLDYLLGRNPLGRSFVAGFGPDPMRHPHHRFWAAGIDPAYPPAPPGTLSGGPNSTGRGDEVTAAMKGRCAPLTCWADDARAFAVNEVAINWNAPLVWLAAWRDATEADRSR